MIDIKITVLLCNKILLHGNIRLKKLKFALDAGFRGTCKLTYRLANDNKTSWFGVQKTSFCL